jgi:hypothetical protein
MFSFILFSPSSNIENSAKSLLTTGFSLLLDIKLLKRKQIFLSFAKQLILTSMKFLGQLKNMIHNKLDKQQKYFNIQKICFSKNNPVVYW